MPAKLILPQLRIRTEFSFKEAFGPLARVAEVLEAMKCPGAAIVDPGTWGHVKWAKALSKTSVKPFFGTELAVTLPDGRKPKAWALAQDTKAFYRFSTAARAEEADVPALFAEARGIVRFAGAALTDPECFDFIDINPASLLQQRHALNLHKKTGKPLVVTCDNAYPAMADRPAFMAIIDRSRVTPQHILGVDELRAALSCLDTRAFNKAVRNAADIASTLATQLPTAPVIRVPGDLRALAEAGRLERLRRGHLSSWPEAYAARLERELVAIEDKGFQSYFIVVADLIAWAKQRMLVGPGRGSSAGSLLCYLVGITEVDPIPHGLLFERFIDITRKDLPDIDIDFNDQKRELCFEYLSQKYGAENVARIGNILTFKPKSVAAEVCKRFAIPDFERFNLLNVLIEYSSGDSRYGKGLEDTLKNTDVGRSFLERHPKAAVMGEVENHASHTGVHAAGVIVSNVRVDEYCTIGPNGVAMIDKPDAEALNLLKIDALGLRTLGILEDTGVVSNDALYALKLDDPKVYDVFNSKRFSAIFQFEGAAQRQISQEVHVDDFKIIDHLTALARPGPLGGGATSHYINRKAGKEEVVTKHPRMGEMLADTYGVVLYQEQVMRIVRELGKFSWEDTTVIRKAMSGRKGKEFFDQKGEQFVKGAAQDGINDEDARAIWNEICNFGAWGMNKSHTCAYAVISYWCAWMKAYHPLEYAAACLRNAKDDDHRLEVLREMAAEGVEYVPFDPEHSAMDWAMVDGRLIGGFLNLHGVGPAKATKYLEQRAQGKLDAAKLAKHPIKLQDLYPLKTKYRSYYEDPESHGCREGSRIATADELPESGDILFLGTVFTKKPRDKNETILVARRNGKRFTRGETRFADVVVKDDTGVPIICRIEPEDWDQYGRKAVELLKPEEDVVLIRGKRVPGYQMIKVHRIKCLTNEEVFK